MSKELVRIRRMVAAHEPGRGRRYGTEVRREVAVRVWARTGPTDLRKGYNGLYGLVQNELGRDPLSGDLFLFVNRRQTSCKILTWDGTGLCIFMKRLERGRSRPCEPRRAPGRCA